MLSWWIGPDVVDCWRDAHFELKEAKERREGGKIEYLSWSAANCSKLQAEGNW